jgi:hypothetical protein
MTDRSRCRGAEPASRVDDDNRDAATIERGKSRLDILGIVDRLDQRLGQAAAALPVRQRPLRIGLDQANVVSGVLCGQRETDGSVLLPLPPFWVANTIVCILGGRPWILRASRIHRTDLHRRRDAEPFSLRTFRPDP